MRRLTVLIDALSEQVGRAVAWLTLLLVGLAFGLVLARYAFGLGWIAGQELVLWLHSLIFLFGAAYTLRHSQHVRVDLFYQRFSPRAKLWADLLGTLLLLLPFCAFMLWISLDYVAASWMQHEASREPGGLPALYLLKSVIPLAATLLALQGVALALRCLLALRTGKH